MNEPTNCGFGYATIGLCQYCSADGENPTDPCCSRAQASSRCANVVLPDIPVSSSMFLTATSSLAASPSSTSAGTGGVMRKNASSLSGGAIAGIVVGGVAAIALLTTSIVLLVCCCRRRRKNRNVSKRQEMAPVQSAAVYGSQNSSTAPSEYEILPGGRKARRSALPGQYSGPPLPPAAAMPMTISDYGSQFATSSYRPGTYHSESSAHLKEGTSVADSDYLVLPGDRRSRISSSGRSDSRLATSASSEEYDAMSGKKATAVTLQHHPRNSVPITDVTSVAPSNEAASSGTDDFKELPGGAFSTKAGFCWACGRSHNSSGIPE